MALDFTNKTPAVSPTAVAELLQRKAQIENSEQNDRFTRMLEAIKTGQGIATSMVNIADANAKRHGVAAASNILKSPVPADQAGQEDRTRRLAGALLQGAGSAGAEKLLDNLTDPALQGNKGFAPQQGGLEVIDKDNKHQVIPAVFKNGQYYFANTDKLIPPEIIVGRGLGGLPVTTGNGSVDLVSRTTGSTINTVSTQNAPVPEKEKGTVSDLNRLEKNDRERVFGDIKEAQADPLIVKGREALRPLSIMRTAIVNNNRVLIDRMGGLFHKAATNDSGNLSAYEQRDPQIRAIFERLKNAGSMWAKGVPSEQTRKELLQSLDSAEKVIKGSISDAAELHATSITEQYPRLNKAAIRRKFGLEVITASQDAATKAADDFLKGLLNGK